MIIKKTIKEFKNMLDTYDVKNTLKSKTIKGGYHYYHKCTPEQQQQLSEFHSMDHQIFNLSIDVKYTNQLSFECGYFDCKPNIYKYEFINKSSIKVLPDFIFNEIVRIYNKSESKNTQKKKDKTNVFTIISDQSNDIMTDSSISSLSSCQTNQKDKIIHLNNMLRHNKDYDILISFFDTCYKQYRFDSYNDWLHIGMAIKNRFGNDGFELFKYFSNKSEKADTDEELRRRYGTFHKTERGLTIATLCEYAKEDNIEEYTKIIKNDFCFGPLELTSTDIARYIKIFKGNFFIWKKIYYIVTMVNIGKQMIYYFVSISVVNYTPY